MCVVCSLLCLQQKSEHWNAYVCAVCFVYDKNQSIGMHMCVLFTLFTIKVSSLKCMCVCVLIALFTTKVSSLECMCVCSLLCLQQKSVHWNTYVCVVCFVYDKSQFTIMHMCVSFALFEIKVSSL